MDINMPIYVVFEEFRSPEASARFRLVCVNVNEHVFRRPSLTRTRWISHQIQASRYDCGVTSVKAAVEREKICGYVCKGKIKMTVINHDRTG
jgi:hypothetical protein